MGNPRQTRALTLLAGHGAMLLFEWQFYSEQSLPAIGPFVPMSVFEATLYLLPLMITSAGIGLSYTALALSTREHSTEFEFIERTSVGVFALILTSAVAGIFMMITGVLA